MKTKEFRSNVIVYEDGYRSSKDWYQIGKKIDRHYKPKFKTVKDTFILLSNILTGLYDNLGSETREFKFKESAYTFLSWREIQENNLDLKQNGQYEIVQFAFRYLGAGLFESLFWCPKTRTVISMNMGGQFVEDAIENFDNALCYPYTNYDIVNPIKLYK